MANDTTDDEGYCMRKSVLLSLFTFPSGLVVGYATCAVWYFKVMYFDENSAESYA